MVFNSTNINKTNDHISPQIIEHKKLITYDIRNPGPDKNVTGLNWLIGSQYPSLDNWIFNCNTYINRFTMERVRNASHIFWIDHSFKQYFSDNMV